MVWCIPNEVLKSKIFFILVLSVSILPSIYYVNYFAISRCLSFAPYFLIGWYLRGFDIVTWLDKLKLWQKCVIVTVAVIGCFVATKIPTGIFWGHEPVDIELIKIIIYKSIAWIIAIINSIALFIVIPKSLSISEGKHTLSYYLFHTIILFPILYYISKVLPNNYLITILILIITLDILSEIRRIKLVDSFLRIKPIGIIQKYKEKRNRN